MEAGFGSGYVGDGADGQVGFFDAGAGEGRVQDGSAFVVGVVADDADVEVIAYLVALRAPHRDGLYGAVQSVCGGVHLVDAVGLPGEFLLHGT